MAKIDKSLYTKEEWHRIREKRRREKSSSPAQLQETNNTEIIPPKKTDTHELFQLSKREDVAFIVGNGTSRKPIDLNQIKSKGVIYGCNALYREFHPDYLVAVDAKMIVEINRAGYQNFNQVWTNPSKAYSKFSNFNYFNPSKGWSSGPTALHMASTKSHKQIYILGFDYMGLQNGQTINNVYADTHNYKKSTDKATYYGNWLKQTVLTIQKFSQKRYIRVIDDNTFIPTELSRLENLKHIYVSDFKEIFDIN